MKNFLNKITKKILRRTNFVPKFVRFTIISSKTNCINITDSKNKSSKVAFTLAEVLITIAIVGVVAAMTLPLLIQMYNKHITEFRLKKFYVDFNNAIRMAEVDYGSSDYWDDYWNLGGGYDWQNTKNTIYKYFAPYIKISKFELIKSQAVFVFPNGSAISYPSSHIRDISFYPKNYKRCIEGKINGQCAFAFEFLPSSYAVSNWSYWRFVAGKKLVPYLYLWNGSIDSLYNGKYGCKNSGGYCVELIRQNNWKIPKDYPRKIQY